MIRTCLSPVPFCTHAQLDSNSSDRRELSHVDAEGDIELRAGTTDHRHCRLIPRPRSRPTPTTTTTEIARMGQPSGF